MESTTESVLTSASDSGDRESAAYGRCGDQAGEHVCGARDRFVGWPADFVCARGRVWREHPGRCGQRVQLDRASERGYPNAAGCQGGGGLQRDMRRVAVTGLGVISPIGLNRDEFWLSLAESRPGIGPIQSVNCEGLKFSNGAEVRGFDPLQCMDAKQAAQLDRSAQIGRSGGQRGDGVGGAEDRSFTDGGGDGLFGRGATDRGSGVPAVVRGEEDALRSVDDSANYGKRGRRMDLDAARDSGTVFQRFDGVRVRRTRDWTSVLDGSERVGGCGGDGRRRGSDHVQHVARVGGDAGRLAGYMPAVFEGPEGDDFGRGRGVSGD